MRKFFACSVGNPNEEYDEENLDRIIDQKAFILHENTPQKGVYTNISAGDILLLKYRTNFVAFGETTGKQISKEVEWNLTAPVIGWHFKDANNPSIGIGTYGLQWNTLEGAGQMGTVKEIKETFGIEKLEKINGTSQLFKTILREIENRKKMENIQIISDLLSDKKQIILQGPPGTGKTYTAKDIAEQIIFGKVSLEKTTQKKNLETTDQFKIIQFHPAYSYEDFVRGITAKSEGGLIHYKSENKTLGKFADIATCNPYSEVDDINQSIIDFKYTVSKQIEVNGKFSLNESVYINEVKVDKFLYYGHDNEVSTPISFDELKLMIINNPKSYTDLNTLEGLSGVGKGRPTYHFKLYEKYKEFSLTYPMKKSQKPFVLIIDEINRANLPAVLGELIYALEYRGEKVESMYDFEGDNSLVLPPNLYIIGTMNTSDRSVGHIDYAIRRRFAFVDVLPEIEPVHPLVKVIFKDISNLFIKDFDDYIKTKIIVPATETLSADFRPEDVWIGHSYFICKKENSDENLSEADAKPKLANKLKFEVLPILKEYIKDGILQDNDKTKLVLQKLIQLVWS